VTVCTSDRTDGIMVECAVRIINFSQDDLASLVTETRELFKTPLLSCLIFFFLILWNRLRVLETKILVSEVSRTQTLWTCPAWTI
jgi:hypothetical protein